MTQTIEVESIRRLDIKPGETLVATVPAATRPDDVERIAACLRAELPNVKVLVVSDTVDLQVLCQSSLASTADG